MSRHGLRVLTYPADRPAIGSERDALDLIGEALGHHADLVVIPADRLDDAFYTLSTGLAGAIVQKFVGYRLRLAVVGDISRHLASSAALSAFVHETNRGRQLWFVADLAELDDRL